MVMDCGLQLSHAVTFTSAPAVAELASHANWAQEFLANERLHPEVAADFDAITPQITPVNKSQYTGPLLPQRHMMAPRLAMSPHW